MHLVPANSLDFEETQPAPRERYPWDSLSRPGLYFTAECVNNAERRKVMSAAHNRNIRMRDRGLTTRYSVRTVGNTVRVYRVE